MHKCLDQYENKFSMELACAFTEQKIIKTKLISQRVTVNSERSILLSTSYTLHSVQMLDPPLNVSREYKTRDHCDVILNFLPSTVFVNCRTNSGKEMTS